MIVDAPRGWQPRRRYSAAQNPPTVAAMGAPTIVLMHSLLVGPLAWCPVADELRGRGYDVVTPVLSGAFAEPPPYYEELAAAVIDAIRPADPARVLLVPHSGAGPLVPSTVAAWCRPPRSASLPDVALASRTGLIFDLPWARPTPPRTAH